MINVSEQVAAVLESSSRTFHSRFLFAGSEVSGVVRSVKVYKGSCGDAQFVPGSIFGSYIDVVMDYCTETLEGRELEYQIGTVVDGEDIWTTIGYFTVYKPSTSVYTTSFTGLGRLGAKMGGMYVSKLVFPAQIKSVLDEISSETGVEIDASAFDTTGLIETRPAGYMHREVIAMIAGIFFGYATEDSSGKVVFGKYATTGNIVETDGDRTITLPTFADLDTEITGIKVVVDAGSTDESEQENEEIANEVGFAKGIVNVAVSNPLMTQALFDANVDNLIGFQYRSGNIAISMGDFRIEPFDCLKVTDSVGVVRYVPCMSVVHTFDGGLLTDVIAPGIENTEGDTGAFRGPLAQAMERFQVDLMSAKQVLALKISAEEAELKYATIQQADILSANIKVVSGDLADYKTVVAEQFSAQDAVLGTLVAKDAELEEAVIGKADITLANIDTANVNREKVKDLFVEIGMIKEAVISEGRITGYLDAVKINASDITTGTLAVERLIIHGSDKSIVYALNNMGELVSKNVDSIDGGVLTERTVTADRIVAHGITVHEITTEDLIGANGWINLAEGTFNYGNQIAWDGRKLDINAEAITVHTDGRYSTQSDIDNTLKSMKIGARNLIRESKTLLFEKYGFEPVVLTDEYGNALTDEYGNVFIA